MAVFFGKPPAEIREERRDPLRHYKAKAGQEGVVMAAEQAWARLDASLLPSRHRDDLRDSFIKSLFASGWVEPTEPPTPRPSL